MQIEVLVNGQAWASAAADLAAVATSRRRNVVIGVPTGNTPLPLYAEMRRRVAAGEWDARQVRWCMVDEYCGPTPESVGFYSWLRRELFEPLEVRPENVLRITDDVAEFERGLALWGGLDLLYLGMGANGHVGFNEPGTDVKSHTHKVALRAETAAANAVYWGGAYIPTHAITMGLATMLSARVIALLVRGQAKAAVLHHALRGPVDAAVPASQLRLASELHVITDFEVAP